MRVNKNILVNFVAVVLYFSGLIWLFNFTSRFKKSKKVSILLYHRICDTEKEDFLLYRKNISASSKCFERQIKYVKKNFDIISLDEYMEIIKDRKKISKDCVVATFDDGYKDNYTEAYPILKKYHVPATIFLATANIGTNNLDWWDEVALRINRKDVVELDLGEIGKYRLQTVHQKQKAIDDIVKKSLLMDEAPKNILIENVFHKLRLGNTDQTYERTFLAWEEIREMSNNGMTFGAHTVSHCNLAGISSDQMKREVIESKHEIEQKSGKPVKFFAYPCGKKHIHYNEEVQSIVKNTGFSCACATEFGREVFDEDNIYQLKRIPIFHYHNMYVFKAKLSGIFDCAIFKNGGKFFGWQI